jgi:methylthioribose-1-phosphate isomerase
LFVLKPLTFSSSGAPLIAIVAVLGLSVDLHTNPTTVKALDDMDDSQVMGWIQEQMAYLKTSRPTAVNLSNALKEVEEAMQDSLTEEPEKSARERLIQAVKDYSEFMLERDVSDNRAIGRFGAAAILKETGKAKVNMVTICNTGSLATAGYGTALGVVRRLHELDSLESITALETRPYNQGSRLTAFEIMEEQMPGGKLICDSSAGALMQVSNRTGTERGAWL